MWDERYSEEEYVYGTEPNEFLRAMAEDIPKGRVLCLAEGEGRNGVYLAGLGCEVHAVDASAVGLEKARKLAESRGVQIQTEVADLTQYTIEAENWDGVVSIFCHLPPPARKVLHQQIVRGLRPGGRLILEAYTPEQLNYKTGGPPVAEMMMTLEALQEELAGLEFIHAREIVRDVSEGKYHTGQGAVVQVVAVKR